MAFDADAFREAHRPWTFTVGGRSFVARLVSAPQILRYQDRITEAAGDQKKIEAAFRWLLRTAFPRRFSYRLRGDPVKLIAALEPAARQAALADFFVALHGGPNPSSPVTPGTTLPTPTPTRVP